MTDEYFQYPALNNETTGDSIDAGDIYSLYVPSYNTYIPNERDVTQEEDPILDFPSTPDRRAQTELEEEVALHPDARWIGHYNFDDAPSPRFSTATLTTRSDIDSIFTSDDGGYSSIAGHPDEAESPVKLLRLDFDKSGVGIPLKRWVGDGKQEDDLQPCPKYFEVQSQDEEENVYTTEWTLQPYGYGDATQPERFEDDDPEVLLDRAFVPLEKGSLPEAVVPSGEGEPLIEVASLGASTKSQVNEAQSYIEQETAKVLVASQPVCESSNKHDRKAVPEVFEFAPSIF
ncbi:SubName: Full=Uncharacterized protein {ECO:0000313/EMBL:CCA68773.1} [Serendipita indica DSM 11827]|nr:SubName: Full=Uncharacterized protein {ECO:0000313/EMBL:CCA68773.1} [Serendipita indica DSM 11827]